MPAGLKSWKAELVSGCTGRPAECTDEPDRRDCEEAGNAPIGGEGAAGPEAVCYAAAASDALRVHALPFINALLKGAL